MQIRHEDSGQQTCQQVEMLTAKIWNIDEHCDHATYRNATQHCPRWEINAHCMQRNVPASGICGRFLGWAEVPRLPSSNNVPSHAKSIHLASTCHARLSRKNSIALRFKSTKSHVCTKAAAPDMEGRLCNVPHACTGAASNAIHRTVALESNVKSQGRKHATKRKPNEEHSYCNKAFFRRLQFVARFLSKIG